MLRILFTGGGTGGHIYPILAVAEELARLDAKMELELRYFGSPENYQSLLSSRGIIVSKILSAKLRRYFDLRNFIDAPKLFIALIQALWKVFWYMPDVLFSKGGPGALPVVWACRFYRIPIIVHESDAIPGLTNKISAKSAKVVLTSFNSTSQFFPVKEIILTGNPVRSSLLANNNLDKQTSKKILGFNPDKPLILVVGGSQGSKRINNFFLDVSSKLINKFQILHQTGRKNFDEVNKEFQIIIRDFDTEEKKDYKIVPFLENDLCDALTAADIVVARAGSGNIFELAIFAKPSILIPLAEAANNHQNANAYEYAKNGAAVVIEEENLKPNIFLTQIEKIFMIPENLPKMSEAAKNFAKPQAAKMIAQIIVNVAIGK